MKPPPPFYQPLKSGHVSIVWPALPTPDAARMAAVLMQFEQSQWWTPDELLALQLHQANALLHHAYRQVPFHRERLAQAGFVPGKALTPAVWSRIPLLTRAELQEAGTALNCPEVPKDHGSIYEISSSGSTGRPVKARGTQLMQSMWDAISLREHGWHRRDFSLKLAAIRAVADGVADYPEGGQGAGWGRATEGVFKTGSSAVLTVASRTDEQAEWLQRVQPHYLLIYPSALRDLLLYCRDKDIVLPTLREVRTLSELLPPETRELCREVWGVRIADMYSTQENGYLALQCPAHEHYHVQAESVLLEVLNDAGEPCAPGEVGQVVVTSLLNFAMPMIRYAVGDLAEVGAPCPCGRGLPVLTRILGRVRDMLAYPDGRKGWALFGDMYYQQIPAIRQFQVVQHAVDDIEIKIVADRRLTGIEEAKLAQWLHQRSGHAFPVRVTYHQEIPRSAAGKYQDFRSAMPGV
ncbi:MAG: phenylacetate--CoA ligase family protein [Kiloniellaceae bacterium]